MHRALSQSDTYILGNDLARRHCNPSSAGSYPSRHVETSLISCLLKISIDKRRTLTQPRDASDLINSLNRRTVLPITEPDRSPRTTSTMFQRRIGGNTAPLFRVSGRAEGETRGTARCVSDHLLQSGSLSALNHPLTPGRYRRKVQLTQREGDSVVL